MANQLYPLRIMIVDDNRDAADLVAEFLVMCGHEAVPVYGGAEALQTAHSFVPDVVFLDLGMPGVNGLEVAFTLRQAPRFQHIKMIALTAWSDDVTRMKTKAVGFDHHLVKPADLNDILGLLSVGACPS